VLKAKELVTGVDCPVKGLRYIYLIYKSFRINTFPQGVRWERQGERGYAYLPHLSVS